MIGPGTGISPFISFIKMRALNEKSLVAKNTVLFFGACYQEKEFYFKDLLERLANE
jgi:sulfite reductase alpha subunit-like flavoprotein